MADQFENQLPQKSDAKWVRALDASGNPILISKEDLASVVGGLLSCVRYSYVTRKETLDEGLTSTSNRLVMFVSSYLQSITPTANYIAGLAIRFYNIETERQFAFDYAGNIYTRMKNLPNGEWTNWERKTT
ncbi:hypothetical protein [Phocaeicola coprophilus]|jgi:hypothetical protein